MNTVKKIVLRSMTPLYWQS